MWLDEFTTQKPQLTFRTPYLNTAGFMGFTPDPKFKALLAQIGAFVTNPISYRPRKAAKIRRVIPYQGGFLLHSGLPNPGLRSVIKIYAARWQRADLPIIVHLIAEDAPSLTQMIRQVETCENVIAIELGFAPQCSLDEVQALTTAAQGELPLIAALMPNQALQWIEDLQSLPLSWLHLSAPRGRIADGDGQLCSGRLYGRSLLPQTTEAVHQLVNGGIQVIAGSGVYSNQDARLLLDEGAGAVALDSVLWLGDGMDVFA